MAKATRELVQVPHKQETTNGGEEEGVESASVLSSLENDARGDVS
jgi:hypothetical protein